MSLYEIINDINVTDYVVSGEDGECGHHYGVEDLRDVYVQAIENGYKLWDTAAVYGMGASEEILGVLKETAHQELILSTKFTPEPNMPREAMQQWVDASRQRLNQPVIDFYWTHTPDDLEIWIDEIAELVRKGKIRYVGVANHHLDQVKRVMEILKTYHIPLAAVQNHMSLLYHPSQIMELLEWCQAHEILFFAYMVLEQGVLTGKYDEHHLFSEHSYRSEVYDESTLRSAKPLLDKMRLLSEKYEVAVSNIAVRWAYQKGTIPIIGVTKTKHIKELNQVFSFRLEKRGNANVRAISGCKWNKFKGKMGVNESNKKGDLE